MGVERAHKLYEAFVLDTLDVARASGARVLVAHAPADAGPWFRERAPWAELWAQPEVEFGERLAATMEEAARRGAARTVMVGTDTPHLAPARLREALDALAGADVVLEPPTAATSWSGSAVRAPRCSPGSPGARPTRSG